MLLPRIRFRLAAVLVSAGLLGAPSPSHAGDWDAATRAFTAGEFAAAAVAFKAFVEARPEAPEGHFMLGRSLLGLKRAGEARAALLRAVELAGHEALYRLTLAKAELGAGGDALETLAVLDPGALDRALVGPYAGLLYKAASQAEDPQRAREVLLRAAAELAGEKRIWLALADVEEKLGDARARLKALEEAHALDPADVTLAQRAVSLAFAMAEKLERLEVKQEVYARAFVVASRLVEAQPSAQAWSWGGKALMGSQEYRKAGQWFARAAGLEPAASHTYQQARCLLLASDPEAGVALAHLDAALERGPNADLRRSIHSSRGLAFQYLKDFSAAAEAYRQAGKDEKVAEMQELAEIKRINEEWERFRSDCERKHRETVKFRAENAELQGTDGWQKIEDEIALQLSGCEEIVAELTD